MTDRPAQPPDPDRRKFFRRFAGDVVTSVGTVLGAAQVIQQQSAEAARELLAAGSEPEALAAAEPLSAAAATSPAPSPGGIDASTAGYRAAFLWDGGTCRLIDQRHLPDRIVELTVEGAADGVHAINDGSILGSAAQAQVASMTVAIVAARSRLSRPYARRATVRGAANALRHTRPGSAAMGAAMDRMLARQALLGDDADGDALVAALRDEADTIVFEATSDHGAIVAHGLSVLPGEADTQLRVLTAGSTGAMGGGQVGTALSVLQAAHHAGRDIHVLVAETRPAFEGSRIAAWELDQAGVSHAIVTDGAAPACIAAGEVEAVLVAADRVAANGDVIAPAGTYPLALAASAAGIPFIVCAATTAVDLAAATGAAVSLEEGRPGAVLQAGGARIAPEGTRVRSVVQDLTPAALVGALVTEEGVLRAPFAPALAAAVTSANARRSASPGFASLIAGALAANGPAGEARVEAAG